MSTLAHTITPDPAPLCSLAEMSGAEVWVMILTSVSPLFIVSADLALAKVAARDFATELQRNGSELAILFGPECKEFLPHLARGLAWRKWALANHYCCAGARQRN